MPPVQPFDGVQTPAPQSTNALARVQASPMFGPDVQAPGQSPLLEHEPPSRAPPSQVLGPSSHSSGAALPVVNRMPSPHTAVPQELVQSSLSTLLASSHSSGPPSGPVVQSTAEHTTVSPQAAGVQSLRQESVSTALPSSQVSPRPVSVAPSPQDAGTQSERHASERVSLLPLMHPSEAMHVPPPQSVKALATAHGAPTLGPVVQTPAHCASVAQASPVSNPPSQTPSPSSHCSPDAVFKMPSPQATAVQSSLHVGLSPESSQSSLAAALTVPSPQAATVQSASQVKDSPESSQTSLAVTLTVPSPQTAAVQSASQVEDSPESSQVSPAVITPLPQAVTVQFESQPSPSIRSPSSQASPAVAMPLPHAVAVQFESQPSPSIRAPSSQDSPAVVLSLPSPQVADVQSLLQIPD